MPSSSMNRRQFLKRLGILGGGIIVYFNSFDHLAWARMQRTGFLGAQVPTDFNAFLKSGLITGSSFIPARSRWVRVP